MFSVPPPRKQTSAFTRWNWSRPVEVAVLLLFEDISACCQPKLCAQYSEGLPVVVF